ncbi:DNA-directed RNA polymerases i, ii, and iii 145 kDa polypeptide [Cryomyces antarcticus]
MSDSQLFEDTFLITDVNAQKYDRVTRLAGMSVDADTALTLDVNSELYPVEVGEHITLMLANTLNLDGTKMGERGWRDQGVGHVTLADMYDYVCYGKVYRFEEGEGDMIRVFVSFGGLLLYLEGPYKKLTGLRIDYVYMLVKR